MKNLVRCFRFFQLLRERPRQFVRMIHTSDYRNKIQIRRNIFPSSYSLFRGRLVLLNHLKTIFQFIKLFVAQSMLLHCFLVQNFIN